MQKKTEFSPEQLHFLRLLGKQYPTVQAAGAEIINLQAIMNLPKGTEHFISDIHGEYEAFLHLLNSCSGVIREKLDELFATTLSQHDRNELATLIYYPEEKLALVAEEAEDLDEWYRITLYRLLELCRFLASKYTRSKVRHALPQGYADVIDELLHIRYEEPDKRDYYDIIISTIIDIGQAAEVIQAICQVIKRLAVDHLHIVGDIYDRGPRADVVMDSLLDYHSVDIQWGNHDILWMGAASGSRVLVATVLANSIHYNNLDVIETGYGISLRPLSIFANEVYQRLRYPLLPRQADRAGRRYHHRKGQAALRPDAQGHHRHPLQAGGPELLQRRPEFGMADRLLLDQDRLRRKNASCIGGGHIPAGGLRLPDRGPCRPLPP